MSWTNCTVEHIKGATYSLIVTSTEPNEAIDYPQDSNGDMIIAGPLKIIQVEASESTTLQGQVGAIFEVFRHRTPETEDKRIAKAEFSLLNYSMANLSNTPVVIKKGDHLKVKLTLANVSGTFTGEITFTRRF